MTRGEYLCLTLHEKERICERLWQRLKIRAHPGMLPFIKTDTVLEALSSQFSRNSSYTMGSSIGSLPHLIFKIRDACDQCGKEMDLNRFTYGNQTICFKCRRKRIRETRKRRVRTR